MKNKGNHLIKLMTCLYMVLSWSIPTFASAEDQLISTVIDKYVEIALHNNINIQLLRNRFETSEAEKAEARANFLPQISAQSRYTIAGGGRMIIIDPSEFMSGLLPPGIVIPKVEFPFLRPHEHETKINISQPIFTGGAILNGYNARSLLSDATHCELAAAEWKLRFDVTEGYLNYLKAVKLVNIKKSVLDLSKDGLELTRALFKQDKLLKNDILRAEVNVSKAESELAEAIQQKLLAQRVFNNILNLDPHSPVDEIDLTIDDVKTLDGYDKKEAGNITGSLSTFEQQAMENRSELKGLQLSIDAMGKLKNVAFSEYLPHIFFSFDYGWQGEEYRFTLEDDYYMASLVFRLNIFDGFAREAKMEKAILQEKELQLQRDFARRNIGLQVEHAYLQLGTSRKMLDAAIEQQRSAEENYRIVNKKYELGMALSLEMNDALTQLDIARSAKVIALYDYMIAIERMNNVLGSNERGCGND